MKKSLRSRKKKRKILKRKRTEDIQKTKSKKRNANQTKLHSENTPKKPKASKKKR
jgi:hypothetical protein